MLGGYSHCRERSRWSSRLRPLLLSRRGLLKLVLLLPIASVSVLVLLQTLLRRWNWHVSPLPAQLSQGFAERLLDESTHFDAATPRGIVLPLYEEIAVLGFSLILELRSMGMTLPVEVPYCGDLSERLQQGMSQQDPLVRFYDVCEAAAQATINERKLFCVDLEHCQHKFRGFDIKVLAVIYSRFQELMLLDADTLFFQSPDALWQTHKYKTTGTLFFHDRICLDSSFLAKRGFELPFWNNRAPAEEGEVEMEIGALHRFLAGFDVTPYRQLGIVGEREPTTGRPRGLHFSFQPSEFLLNSHSWALRTGHQMDSSLLLWNKARQPRATAILASFVSLNGLPSVPSYGDKELFWLACELAETAYAFSDFAVGAVGSDVRTAGRHNDGVLCGEALHHFPVQLNSSKGPEADVEPLYMNSDNILEWGRNRPRLYRTAARPAELYPGSFTERKLPLTCPFDVTIVELTPLETRLLTQRQEYFDEVTGWVGDEDRGARWYPFR